MKTKTIIGIVGSIIWLVVIVAAAWWKKDDLCTMDLNEIGDFLAGAFSPLALWWLVLGYFQQGEELKLNTRALEVQVEELRQSVVAQQLLAESSHAQTELFREANLKQFHKERDALAMDISLSIAKRGYVLVGDLHGINFKMVNQGNTGFGVTFRVPPEAPFAIFSIPIARVEAGAQFDVMFKIQNKSTATFGEIELLYTDLANEKRSRTYFYSWKYGDVEIFHSVELASERASSGY